MKTPAPADPQNGSLPPGDAEIRATAWALGQLEDTERTAFEQEMASNPALAAYAQEMRAFCAEISLELPSETDESAFSLPETQRAPIVAALSKTPVKAVPVSFARRHWRGLALFSTAAAAAAGVTLIMRPAWLPELSPPPRIQASAEIAAAPQPFPSVPPAAQAIIRPVMPQMLFAGTPLPRMTLPPNFDRSQEPVLEAAVPAGTVLLSKGCPVTSSDPDPIGDLSLITDGDKQGDDGYFVDLAPGKVWVTIDLGKTAEINLLWVWHFHKQGVIFRDVVVRISDDPLFKAYTTVFNNDFDNSLGFGVGADQSYIETNHGRAMPVKNVRGRYVRFHSNGRDLDDTNQYIEVEVYGRPEDPGAPGQNSLLAAAGTGKAELKQLTDKLEEATASHLNDGTGGAKSAGDPLAANSTVRPAMPQPIFQGAPLDLYSAASPAVPAKPSDNYWALQPASLRAGLVQEKLARAETPSESMATAEFAGKVTDAKSLDAASAESYQRLPVNPFLDVTQAPLSTFSIDVDTASYANVRRFLNAGSRPPAEAVRLEELVNYFPCDEPGPADGKPFAVRVEVTSAPWEVKHRLARVVLKGKEIAAAARPASNLVFLVDVSGSMNDPNKLPLVQQSLRLLADRLTENDRVSLVTYAGSSQLVLPSTNGQNKAQIRAAIDSLSSGGGTNGAGGIAMAYQQAAVNFIQGGVNRVILATDGDFNVGATSHDDLLSLITDKAKSGVFLSVLGYGMGNLKDDTMELLADKGNGNYAYIDSLSEARKSLVEQMSGTLVTIAKDVKIQIEFNPTAVKSYKLLGYENRLLAKEDFNNDQKDAGEIGAGHTVTALYEIIPAGQPDAAVKADADGLKYQQAPAVITPKPEPTPAATSSGEIMNVKLRWKQPHADTSELMEIPVKDSGSAIDQASSETRWAAAVAGFARLLRGDAVPPGTAGGNGLTWENIRQLARSAKGPDPLGYRGEFLQLIDKAESLSR